MLTNKQMIKLVKWNPLYGITVDLGERMGLHGVGKTTGERWRLKNPSKRWAERISQEYNKKNNIRKKYCEGCKKKENLQMHHSDYSKPLEVVTLCAGCHNKIKKGIFKAEKTSRRRV